MKTWLIAASAIGGIFALDIIRLSAIILKKNMGTDGMIEYIEREAISEEIRKYYYKNPPNFSYGEGFDRGLDRAQRAILDAPAADVAPVRHGRWVQTKAPFMNECEDCSACGYKTVWGHRYNYCPNCGAKMDGE